MKLKALITAMLLAVLTVPAVAEVSVTPGNHPHLVLTARDGQVWTPVRKAPAHLYLNPYGDLRGDGAPSASVNPATGLPEVAWARNDEGSFDVVFSHWDGREWTVFETVGGGEENHLTPHLLHDGNGSRYVLWTGWQEGASTALVASATVDGRFSAPRALNGAADQGRYPGAVTDEDSLWTVHEERRGATRYIILKQFGLIDPAEPGAFVPKGNEIDNPLTQGATLADEGSEFPPGVPLGGLVGMPGQVDPPRVEYSPSDPQVHAESGVVWVDWFQGERGLGYAIWDGEELDGSYFLAMDDKTDLERARREVRRIVTGRSGNGR
jgi:hypothetical protein